MGFTTRSGHMHTAAFRENWGKFLVWGIALSILGIAAMSAAAFTTLVSVFLLGILITIGGAVVIIDSLTFWRGKPGFILHSLSGALYLVVGLMLMINPLSGSVSLTLLLGICYTLLGLFRIIAALSIKQYRWKLSLFNGIITLLIGVLILRSWPESSLYIIGLFIGIDLLVCGWVYIMSAIAGRNALRHA